MAFVEGDNAYCSVADIADQHGGFTVPAAWTTSIKEDQIVQATSQIQGHTKQHFGKTSQTVELSGDGTPLLDLTQETSWSCLSISELLYRADFDADFDWGSDGETIDVDMWMISHSTHAVERVRGATVRASGGIDKAIWRRGPKNYRVVGIFGMDEIPRQIVSATIWLVREAITPGITSKFERGVSERFPDGYAITRAKPSSIESLTGYPYIDDLLRPFVDNTPMMFSIF